MADLIGQRLGQYEIVVLLGQGGMASVYRAQQLNIKRQVAIKVIKRDLADSEDFLKRFEREAETVAALSHPHILKMFEYGEHEGMAYLVMELLTGGSLSEMLRREPLSLTASARILDQIAGALDYAHSRSIIHRDLKPANVLLDDSGNAFLTDFGIAKLLGSASTELTKSGAIVGTPAYMAPELWRGEAVDRRSDIYALGVMLFEMLSGRLPFVSDTPFNFMYKHFIEAPPTLDFRPEIPIAVNIVIARALAKDREARYDSASAMAADFRSAAFGSAAKSAPASESGVITAIGDMSIPQTALSTLSGHAPQTITPIHAADQERRAIENLEAELRARTPPSAAVRPRFINTLPQDTGDRFKDRVRQQSDIVNLLTEQTRLISIYGRGGVGKTALGCRVLANLQRAKGINTVDGMVYLSARSTGISLERIMTDFLKLLDGEAKASVETAHLDPKLSIAAKVAALLSALGEQRYILLLDNLESLQNPDTGELIDPDLRTFLEAALSQSSGLRIIVTSREPLTLPRPLKTWERLVPLEEGLPTDDAVALLRAFDADGAAGLRDAPVEKLTEVSDKLRGFPRALEAVAGLLLEDPLLSLDDLLYGVGILSGEVTSTIVQEAIARLNPEAIRVMEALAVFKRPVPQVAVEYLLAPYIDTSNLRAILARLVRGYFASYNKVMGTFAIHRIDQEYCYSRIPEGSPGDTAPYTKIALNRRAADFYMRQRKPEDEWRTFDDLSPQIAEFDHRVLAGDYDTAASLIATIDAKYLFRWGFYRTAAEMHERLYGKVKDPALAVRQTRYLGIVYSNLGRLAEATRYVEEALGLARATGDRYSESGALNSLGLYAFEIGKTAQAIDWTEQGLPIARELGNHYAEGIFLTNLGIYYSALEQLEAASRSLEQALAISKELDDQEGEGLILHLLGVIALDKDQFREALLIGEDGLKIGQAIDNVEVRHRNSAIIALAWLFQGDFSQADSAIQIALKNSVPTNDHNVQAISGVISYKRGDNTAAVKQFERLLQLQNQAHVENYDALYALGLGLSGLALCGQVDRVAEAETAYKQAYTTNHDKAIVKRARRLFDVLAQSDTDHKLDSVRAVMKDWPA